MTTPNWKQDFISTHDSDLDEFRPVNWVVSFGNAPEYHQRQVRIPTQKVMDMDQAETGVNATLDSQYKSVEGVPCKVFAEIKVTGRTERRHSGGRWGWKARVQVGGVWHEAVLGRRGDL